jgi:TP901 family phage tail tape measure protein
LSFVKEYGDLASKINNKLKEEHDDDTTSEHGKNNSFWGAFLNRGSGGWSGGLGRLAGLSIRGAIVGAGWAAAGYMKNRVKGGFDMAGELAQIQAISKATDTEMDRLADTSVRLASSFRVATKDSLALFKSLSRLGVESKNIDTVSKAAVALSTAVGGDLEKAGEVLVTTMNAFNVSYSNADKFASKFVNTLNSSAIDLNKFNTIMSYVAVSGESVGVSFDEAAAMISVLANSGMKASQVGTSLRTIFSELAGRGESLSTVIGRLKDGLMTYADASELVGVRAANSLSILVDKWDEVKTAQSEAFNTIADASSQAYYTIEKNFGNKIATMFKGLTAKMNKFFADMMVVDDEKAVANMMKSDDDDVRAAGFKEGFSRWVKQNNKTIIGQSSQSLENLVDEYIKSQKGKQIVSFSGGSNVSSSTVVTGDIGSEASRYREQLIASAKKQQSEEFFSKTEPIMLEWYNNQIKSGRYDDNLYGDISGNPALRREALKYWSEMASNEGVDLPLASIMGFMDNNFTNFNKINTYRGAVDEVKRIVKKLKETEDGTFTKAGKWESKRSYSGKTYSRAQLEENDRLINTMEKLISEWGIGEEDLNFILNSLGMKPMSKQPLRMNTTFSEINAQLKNALPTEMIEDVVSSVELLREDLNEELSKTSSRSEKERLIMEFADKIKSKLDLISEDSLNLYADSMTDFLDSLKEDTLRAYDVQKSNLDAKYAKSAKTKADKAAYELESNRLINERDRTLGNIDRFSLDTTRAGIKGRRSINSANKGLLSHIGIRISGFDEDSFMDVQKALEDVNSSFYGDIKSTKGYSKKDLANVKDKLKNLGELIDTKFTTSMLKLAEDEALVNKQYEKYDGSIYQKMGMSEDEFNQEKSMYLERIGKGRVAAATAKTNAMKNVEVQTADVMSKENELHNAKVDVWGGVSQDGLSTALDAYKTFNQLALQESLDRINREIEAENNKANKLQGINSSLQKSGLISAEQYAAEKERIDKENLDAVNKLNEKAFEQQKKAQKQEATINYTQKLAEMAINVLVANSKQGVLGIATAPAVIAAYTAIASAQYAVQMAAIGKQKFVPQKYEQGGYVDGASHAQGGIPISVNGDIREMEGGEFIVNKRATAKHLSLLNAINNSGKYADGGYVSPRYSSTISNDQVSISQGDSLNLEMVKLLTELRNNPIKAYVRISDIEQGNELREINRNRFTI